MKIKCGRCRKEKEAEDFLKNGKTLKTCISCREGARNKTEPKSIKAPNPEKESKPVKKTEPKSKSINAPNPEKESKPVKKAVAKNSESIDKFNAMDRSGETYEMAILWKQLQEEMSPKEVAVFRASHLANCCETKEERFRQMDELLEIL